MKQIVFFLTIVMLSACGTMNQQERDAARAADEAEQAVLFTQALEAVKAKDFVLEADRVEFRRGNFVYVQPNTNFVSVNGDKATVQLALSNRVAGPNGIGGITVDGNVSGFEMKEDRRGNVNVTMMVQGVGISAQVTINMVKGNNKCTATVLPNFSNNRVSFTGDLYPTELSNVYKARAL